MKEIKVQPGDSHHLTPALPAASTAYNPLTSSQLSTEGGIQA
jgi:hypothetical protein